MRAAVPRYFWLLFFIMLALQVAVWGSVRDARARWTNVPPVPSSAGIRMMGLGDSQFAYRLTGITLQNLGGSGGREQPFRNYDYTRLKSWFMLTHELDDRSNYAPYLAAYYFGSVDDPERIKELIEYLRITGKGREKQRWRWLAQAVYMARFQVKDMDLAYKLATELAALPDPDLPFWARQMPAFVLTAKGDKEAAYDILVEMLKTEAKNMPPEEITAIRAYICREVLTLEAAQTNPLCEGLK